MENGHTNIAYSAYKDYQNLTTNDFTESKQQIWELAKKDFRRTHKRITDRELSEFIKIYISHYISEKHCYTSYQIVEPCRNIAWDRKHDLYIDKEHKIVILESTTNYFGKISEITEKLLKQQSVMYSAGIDYPLTDQLAGRTDNWLQAYDNWLRKDAAGNA